MKKILILLFALFFLVPVKAYADVHNRPTTTSALSPTPSTPGTGLSFYSDPVTVTLSATADTGYSITNTYYKVYGGLQQTYSAPFTVSGSGTHSIEYWSIDNTGLEEYPHVGQSFIISPQNGVINSLAQDTQNNTLLNVSVQFDNFAAYTSQLYNNDCYNDPGASFQLYNANTGALVSSQSGYSHCGSLGNGNSWLGFPPVQLDSGTYFIHYHGGDNEDWVTGNYTYTAPVPHNHPTTTSTLAPTPTSPGSGLTIYSDPVTVTLQSAADSGYNVANTYYKVDGGSQQTYSVLFTVSGSGTHSIEYWSVDNTGLEELPHQSRSFTVNPLHGNINSITQNSTSIDLSVQFDNFVAYTSQLYNNDCYNDPGASFEIYNASTGAVVSYQSGYSHCGSLGNGNSWLAFPPLQLASGTYFIHYHGGNNNEWITDNYTYTAPVPVHNRPTTTSMLAPTPSTPGAGFALYSNPVTVTLSATADTGYSIANTYHKVDGGAQQTYSTPFTVSGSGTHGIEYWSVDSSGLEELPHASQSFIISPQHGVINSLVQGSISIDVSVHFDNFDLYMAQLFNNDCYNDPGASFELYNANTGTLVSSQSGYSHCGILSNGNNWLEFPPLQINPGTYFIHYHGGDNEDWVTDNFIYTGNQPPVVNSTPNATINEGDAYSASGSFSDPTSTNWITTVDYGDGSGVQPLTLSGTNFSLSHVYKDNGVYTVTVSVTDNQGAIGTGTATITVNNSNPSVGMIMAPTTPQQVNTPITASAPFTDPGVLDTHTALWNWGDGITSNGTVTESNGSGSVSNTHTYQLAGVYTITLTVTDKDGGQGSSIFQYVVVYDPSAGYVTGAGTITSPQGAYAQDPSLSGKAIFGFVSKYQNGANLPTGSTQFRFIVANFSFKSTSYDWLVVGGAKAQYKGSGTINGSGDYGFMLTSIDGQINGGGGVDKFRIKITDKTTGNVIYDNQLGASDTSDPSTMIDSGSITIHN